MKQVYLEGIDAAKAEEIEQELIRDFGRAYSLPFVYDGSQRYAHIPDQEGNLAIEIRGWGRLSNKYGDERAAKIQDKIGALVCEKLNEEFGFTP